MDVPKQKNNDHLIWFVPVVMFVSAGLANAVGDMLLICMIYGPRAYFDEGLRIVKHKPYTLSTGPVLSGGLDFLGWLIDLALWLGLIFF